MGKPDCLICLLRNLYAGQEATVQTGHGTTDWFQIAKGRGTRDQIANICWIIKKESYRETSISALLTAKAFDYVDHNKLWKILKEMGIPDHLTS